MLAPAAPIIVAAIAVGKLVAKLKEGYSRASVRGFAAIFFTLILLASLRITVVPRMENQPARKPLALGFGEDGRYVLYSDGGVWKLLGRGESMQTARINLSRGVVESATLDFEVYGGKLYLYAYRSINASSGETTVRIYDLNSGRETWVKNFFFEVKPENRVLGSMVLAASACGRGLAVMVVNTTHSTIEVFTETKEGFGRTMLYSGRMAMSIYRWNDTLVAATFETKLINNVTWVKPVVTDLILNKTLFSLPALIPVAMLTYLFIQVFNRGGEWECHVSVYNRFMNRMEYYIVYPEKQGLIDSQEARVSPYMDYLTMDQPSGSKITFRKGENLTVSHRLSIVPQGAYVLLDPKNGIMDADPERKALLAKVVEGDRAKILYITEASSLELYTLNASSSSKAAGFYAVLVQDTAYIINPENNQLVVKTIGKSENNLPTITIIIIVCIAFTLAIVVFNRRRFSQLTKRSARLLI